MLGAILGEAYLIGAFGLYGTSLAAAAALCIAAAIALLVAKYDGDTSALVPQPTFPLRLDLSYRPPWRLLLVSFGTGCILLCLEVVPRDYNFWIYIVTNRNHSVLYIGVTNRRRTWEHREGTAAGFGSKYQCKKLIYYEHYRDVRDAIARESQLKKWSRSKKIELVNRLNPRWDDLGADVLQDR